MSDQLARILRAPVPQARVAARRFADRAAAEHHLHQAARIAIRAGAPIWETRAVNRLQELAEPAR